MRFLSYKNFLGTVCFDEDKMVLHGVIFNLFPEEIKYQSTSIQGIKREFRKTVNNYLKENKTFRR